MPPKPFFWKILYLQQNFQCFSMPSTLKKVISCSNALEKFKKYGKLLPIYSKNVLQILLSQLSLALAK